MQHIVGSKGGHNMIKGTVSLDNKTANHCADIVLGFYRFIAIWLQRLEARIPSVPASLMFYIDKLFRKGNAEEFGDLITIRKLKLPHGSTKFARQS